MAKLTFTGRVEYISPKENGTDRSGKDYTKFYIIVADGEQYENKNKVDCFNKTQEFQVGQLIECELTAKVNPHENKHYLTLNLWSAKVISAPTQQAAQSQNEPPF